MCLQPTDSDAEPVTEATRNSRTRWTFRHAVKTRSDAQHDPLQTRFGDFIECEAPFPPAGQQSPVFHQTQMFRGHVAGDSTRLRELADGVLSIEKHLHNAKPMRMSKRSQAMGRLVQRTKVDESVCFGAGHSIDVWPHLDIPGETRAATELPPQRLRPSASF